MANGIEKRRFKRMKADLSLNVSSLFKQDNMEIKNLDSPIKVINISEGGIAFESKSMLPINFYFNAALNLSFVFIKDITKNRCHTNEFAAIKIIVSALNRLASYNLDNTVKSICFRTKIKCSVKIEVDR